MQQGFVFCCGLFYLKSCGDISSLLEHIVTVVVQTGDDQVTLNRSIASMNVKWSINSSKVYYLQMNNMRFLCCRETIHGIEQQNGIRVSLIPHHLFQRLHMSNVDAYVKHFISPKFSRSKLSVLDDTQCLFLRPDWKDIDFREEPINRIDSNTHE